MNIEDFIKIFEGSFDNLETIVTSTTNYKDLAEWTSMQALFFIAHLDDKTSVVFDAEDLIKSRTIEDLYNVFLEKYT